jgi:hypothetical protein
LTAAAPAASAAEWRLVSIENEGRADAAVAFADVASLARDGDAVQFELDIRFNDPGGLQNGARLSVRADCVTHRWEAPRAVSYLGAARVAQARSQPRAVASPGSNIFNAIDAVCAGRYLSSSVDPVAYARTRLGQR